MTKRKRVISSMGIVIGIISICLSIFSVYFVIFIDGIENMKGVLDILGGIVLGLLGVFCLKFQYAYDDEIFFPRVFSGDRVIKMKYIRVIKIKEITEIDSSFYPGSYVIRSKTGNLDVFLPLEKRKMKKLIEHFRNINPEINVLDSF